MNEETKPGMYLDYAAPYVLPVDALYEAQQRVVRAQAAAIESQWRALIVAEFTQEVGGDESTAERLADAVFRVLRGNATVIPSAGPRVP